MFRRMIVPALVSAVLAACSTTPERKEPTVGNSPSIPVEQATPDYAPQDYLQLAREANSPEQKVNLLLDAADAWQADDCDSSLRVIEAIREQLHDRLAVERATLIEAECIYEQNLTDLAQQVLLSVTFSQPDNERLLQLRAKLAEQQKQPLEAARLYHRLGQYDPGYYQQVWPMLKRLSLKQLEQAVFSNPELNGWIQLAIITRQYATEASLMATQLARWQQNFADHPANTLVPQDLTAAINTQALNPQRVVVILPLSGKLASQGEAIKQGLLASYFAQAAPTAHLDFIDSQSVDMVQAAEQAKQADLVIGPLIKDHIETLQPLIPDTPMLALNSVDQTVSPLHYYFALAPEDEGKQLAESLALQQYKHPIVVTSAQSSMVRMATSFTSTWRAQQGSEPPQVEFSDNKAMRDGLEGLLEVDHSNERIKAIQSMHPGEVFAFHRNRQDVDAIVLFASPQETELLVPIIESSISPFSDIIPVFASSRSFSHDLKANSLRDLNDLSFIDMPWMLPDHQWQALQQQSDALWPNRRDSLKRLFAMGHDAWILIPKLRHMQVLPEMRVDGLTGKLQLDANQTLQRTLSWGKISQQQVIKLARE